MIRCSAMPAFPVCNTTPFLYGTSLLWSIASCQSRLPCKSKSFCRRDSRLRQLRPVAQQSQAQSYDREQLVAPANSWQTYLSSKTNFAEALEEVIEGCSGRLGSQQPQLAMIFVSSAFADQYHEIVPELRKRLPSLTEIAGCSVSIGSRFCLLCMLQQHGRSSLHDATLTTNSCRDSVSLAPALLDLLRWSGSLPSA